MRITPVGVLVPRPRSQCNNPLTKEPKLSVAMRLLPEWTEYDREVRDLQERVARAGETEAATAATDANAPRKSEL